MAQSIDSKDVFTPTRPAHKTFIERSSKINDHLVDALMTPGKQIVIYGHSGSGKTTLIINKLDQLYERKIITRCMESMTYESIIIDAFDQMNQYYLDEKIINSGNKINPSFNIGYNDIKAAFNVFETNSSKAEKEKRLIPPQLTVQRLAKFFGEINCCWVLEDFHKVATHDKVKVAQAMKIFVDTSYEYPDLKIIALGAVNTARQVIEYDQEMNNRIAEIYVPLMSEEELGQIISVGEKLLNIKFDQRVKDNIVSISCGLPSICHQLCLNICFIKRIYKTYDRTVYDNQVDTASITLKDFKNAIEKFINEKSDTFKSEYDRAIKTTDQKRVNKPKIILQSIINFKKNNFHIDEIIKLIVQTRNDISENDVKVYISEFITPSRSEVLIYDSNSNTYSFNNILLKSYCKLKFKSDESNESDNQKNENIIINRLLKVIENDSSKNLFDIFNEDNITLAGEDNLF